LPHTMGFDLNASMATTNQPKIVTLSLPRSGSTFIMKMFQQHRDIVSLFEVTKWMPTQTQCVPFTLTDNNAQFFRDIFQCDFSSFKFRLGNMWADLSGPELLRNSCLAGDPPSKSVAIKEIWPWSTKIDYLRGVLGDDLRIISLMRDPRGFVSSFVSTAGRSRSSRANQIYFQWGLFKVDLWQKFCLDNYEIPSTIAANKAFLQTAMQSRLVKPYIRMATLWTVFTAITNAQLEKYAHGKYINVSHSELSLAPMETVQKIFTFIGKPNIPPNVLEWVTHETSGGDALERHGTARDSKQMDHIWEERLTPDEVRDIESIASPVMQQNGFMPIYPLGKLPLVSPETRKNGGSPPQNRRHRTPH